MTQVESRSASQESADDLARELYPDIFTASPTTPAPVGRAFILPQHYANAPQNTSGALLKPPTDTGQPHAVKTRQLGDTGQSPSVKIETVYKAGETTANTDRQTFACLRIVKTGQLPTISTTPQKSAEAPSLTAALQATMAQPRKRPIVIPGSRKSASRQKTVVGRQLHPRLRSIIILTSVLLVLLLSLFIFTPLSSAANQLPFLNGVIDWVHTQQINWTQAIAHVAPSQQNNSPAVLPPVTLPTSEYVAIARQDALNVGIPPEYFVRQINQESGFNPNAVSPSGAVGIAQFLPSTARGLGVNPYDPVSALQGAANYMANYARQYNGDYAKALAAYNAGSGTVDYAIRIGGANWLNFLPAETRNYIHVIMGI